MTAIEQWIDSDTVLIIDRIDSAPGELVEAERALTSRMARPRLREFTVGRTLAHRALELLQHFGPPSIPMGDGGEPIWPQGVSGSISHSWSHAAALVARSSRHASVGVDIDDGRLLGVDAASELMCANEVAAVLKLGWARDTSIAQNIVFLAKEALFKYQFPLTGTQDLDFDEVEVHVSRRIGILAATCKKADPRLNVAIESACIYFQEIQSVRICWVLPNSCDM